MTERTMKRIAVIMFVCCVGSSSAWAIDCLSAAGNAKDGHYHWREIDGRKCWFLKAANAPIPPKSALRWTTKAKQEATAKPEARPTKPESRPTQRVNLPAEAAQPAEEVTGSFAVAPAAIDTPDTSEPKPPIDKADRSEPKPAPTPGLRIARVRPSTGASPRVDNGLMSNTSMSDMQPFGAPRPKPAHVPSADFNTRFKGGHD